MKPVFYSLLYPDKAAYDHHISGKMRPTISEEVTEQLGLCDLSGLDAEEIVSYYTSDADVIRYRQSVFRDMCGNPSLTEMMRKITPIMSDIGELRRLESGVAESTESYLYSITEIELYTTCMAILAESFARTDQPLESTAFQQFRDYVLSLTESDYFKDLNKQLTALTSRVREIKSVTIGVNLDRQLKPEYAGLLSINNAPFKSGEALDKILRLQFGHDDYTCIAPLVPFRKGQSENQRTALTSAFYSAISDALNSSVRAWKKIVQTYLLENTDFLVRLIPEFHFLLGWTETLAQLDASGLPMTYPIILPMAEKAFSAVGLCNPDVALKVDAPMIGNDFAFDERGRIFVLTGPNRGGKSVFTCALGQAQAMMQLGLPVAASRAEISPADGIYTHFPEGAADTVDRGRLGEECARLAEIFRAVSDYSMVLLDESLSSTGAFEGAYIAGEVLSGFALAGVRGIFSTHLHTLAASVSEMNARVANQHGVAIDTLVAEMDEGQRSFKIVRAQPDGKSYARDIADKYGLSYDKIQQMLKGEQKND